MRELLTVIIDLLFPPSEHQLLIRKYTDKSIDLYNLDVFNETLYLSSYSNPVVKAAITENKFCNNQEATLILSELLNIWINKQPQNLVFIPIPLGPKRLRERGYNQVENILKNTNVPITTRNDILQRKKDTEPQSQLAKLKRQKNIKDAFICDSLKMSEFKNTRIVLIDDVITTGSTMVAARASLVPHLDHTSTITCLSIAH